MAIPGHRDRRDHAGRADAGTAVEVRVRISITSQEQLGSRTAGPGPVPSTRSCRTSSPRTRPLKRAEPGDVERLADA